MTNFPKMRNFFNDLKQVAMKSFLGGRPPDPKDMLSAPQCEFRSDRDETFTALLEELYVFL